MSTDFYGVLGVSRNATTEQIKDRFLQLDARAPPRPLRRRREAAGRARLPVDHPGVQRALQRRPAAAARHRAGAPHRPEAPTPTRSARVFMQRGVKAYKAKNFIEAADNFSRATEADPDNALAWHHLARTCMQEERWLSRATAAVARACELEPMKAEYHKLAGQIFLKSRRSRQGGKLFPPGDKMGRRRPRGARGARRSRGQAAQRWSARRLVRQGRVTKPRDGLQLG